MSFKEVNSDFINKVNAQLTSYSSGEKRRDEFLRIFKDSAIERIRIYYRREVNDIAYLPSFNCEVLQTQLGNLLKQPFRAFMSELIVDIYLEQECDILLNRIRNNSDIRSLFNGITQLPDILEYQSETADYLSYKLSQISKRKEATGKLARASYLASKMWEFAMNDSTAKLEEVLTHFTKYYLSLGEIDKQDFARAFLIYLNELLLNLSRGREGTIHVKLIGLLKMVREFRSKRKLDISLAPLFDHDAIEPKYLGQKYLDEHKKFINSIKMIEQRQAFINKVIPEGEILKLLQELINSNRVLPKLHEDIVMRSLLKLDKKRILEAVGESNLHKLTSSFLKNFIRRKYIYEVILN